MTPRFLPAAEAEFLQEVRSYAAARDGLGIKFVHAVVLAVGRVLANPEGGTPGANGTRSRIVKGFPFSVTYQARGQELGCRCRTPSAPARLLASANAFRSEQGARGERELRHVRDDPFRTAAVAHAGEYALASDPRELLDVGHALTMASAAHARKPGASRLT